MFCVNMLNTLVWHVSSRFISLNNKDIANYPDGSTQNIFSENVDDLLNFLEKFQKIYINGLMSHENPD